MAQGAVRAQDPHLLRLMLLGALQWSVQWFKSDGGLSVTELAEETLTFFLSPPVGNQLS